ncbi:putative Pleckstrin-like proteiny domain-containing family G member 1 [Hypsibius exemplaris]|uniref:Pleckstrin-like proteiny domain-containing family G member 1 n=1 Tax=Hypsibius exemplaris TaxID=2072580 RepID=A0A1W0X8Z4_HYPEX|nr:putative Pleckstrin-like proteiny domain-containing family G member 1 [Hypsibius exemplaris]
MPRASSRTFSDYKMDLEWREIFGSSIDLTGCMVDILESFNMATTSDCLDIGLPPDEVSPLPRKTSPLEYEVSSVDSSHTFLSGDSGVNDLDRNSIWRNSSSSNGSAGSTASSHQSALSLIGNDGTPSNNDTNTVLATPNHYRHSSLSLGSKTHFIMDEVLHTEKNYVEDLRQICQGYLQPMRESPLFSSEDLNLVFANMEKILAFHRLFFAALVPPDLMGPAYLAQCFNEHADSFEIYTEYCINFPASVKHLAQLTTAQPEWFAARQADIGHSLQLGTYLLKPIQRILKYHLLLEKLLDNCDCDALGYQWVSEAYESMRNIAQKINEVQNQKERKIRLEELELRLQELPLSLTLGEFGELLLDDLFRLTGAKGERNLFLFANGLLIVKRKEDGTFLFKNYIAHSNLMLSEVIPENPLHFSVIAFDNPKALTVIEAKSMEQKRAWTSRLKTMMLKNFGVSIPEHVQQLVMQLGEVHQGVAHDSSPRRFRPPFFHTTTAPDYLQRRRAKSPVRDAFVKNSVDRMSRQARRQTLPIIDLESAETGHIELPAEDACNSKRSEKKRSVDRKTGKDKTTKTTAVFHVSTDYIPRTKEDEFMYEEKHVTSEHRPEDPNRRKSSTVVQDSFLTISPRKQSRQKSVDNIHSEASSQDATTANQLSGMFKYGFRTAFGKAKQALKPIMKNFNTEESFESHEWLVPGNVDCIDSAEPEDGLDLETFTEAVNALTLRPLSMSLADGNYGSDDFYERNLDLLDSMSGGGPDHGEEEDSAIHSDKEAGWRSASFSTGSPSPTENVKIRRSLANAEQNNEKRTGCSIKRKGAIKKRPSMPRTKSAPATPLVTDKMSGSAHKVSSSLIQQKIRSLEERSLWRSTCSIDSDFNSNGNDGKRPEAALTQKDTDASSSLFLEPKSRRESYVTMMVNKIESASDLKMS